MRLTHYDELKERWQINNDYGAVVIDELNYAVGEATDKLAAYEDTGLEPEAVKGLWEYWIGAISTEIAEEQSCVEVNRAKEIACAETEGRLVILPCKIGDKVRDKIADYVFTVEQIELGHKAGTLFRCGNPGTDDYMAFYDFEIGEKIEILTHAEAEAALKKEKENVG